MKDLGGANNQIEKESFVSKNWWFDQTESSNDLPQHEIFERKKFIKEAIFEANAIYDANADKHFINSDEMCKSLKCLADSGANNFAELLFSQDHYLNSLKK